MIKVLRHLTTPLRAAALSPLLLVALAMVPDRAMATDVEITAEFTPDGKDPGKRTFTNTTGLSGLCSTPGHTPTCLARGIWSIDTRIRGSKRTRSRGERNNFYFGMPGARSLTVHNEAVERQLRVKIVGIGIRFDDTQASAYTPPNCTVVLTNFGTANPQWMRLLRRQDDAEGSGACSGGSSVPGHDGRPIEQLDIVYELEAPNPLEMPGGTYTGSTTYTIGGAGSDIDLGDGVTLDSPEVTFNFTLTVNHYFDVRFPPGSHRALLAPLGGWAQWTEHGRAPTALVKELPFQLSSSSLFGVTLRCQYPSPDGRCAIRNQTSTAEDVPLDLRLTVAGVHDRTLGRDVVDYPLTTDMAAPLLDPQGYVYERPSRLGLRVDGAPLADMLTHPGSRYAGDITVIFDVDL